jgi:hypothetical protein
LHQGTAQIRVGETVHNITFTILALRVMTAMEVLGAAYREIVQGIEQGKYDPVLGSQAAAYIKNEARNEFRQMFPDTPQRSVRDTRRPKFPNLVDNENVIDDGKSRDGNH